MKYDATVYGAVYAALSLEHQIQLLTGARPSCPWIKELGKLADSI